MLRTIARRLGSRLLGGRTWTPPEIRELIRQGDLQRAREGVARLSPRLTEVGAEADCLLGEICFHERADATAEAHFRAALRAVPGMPDAHYGLSLIFSAGGDSAAAVRHAFFAHSSMPGDPRFLAQLGYCQLRLKNFGLAEMPLRRATLLAPGDGYAWNNLGIILRLKGELAEAADCFRHALEIHPDDPSPRENLLQIEAEQRHAAVRNASSASESGPAERQQPADARFQAAREAEASGQIQLAIDHCELLALEPATAEDASLELNRLYRRAGDPQSGIDALETHLTRQPHAVRVVSALGTAKLEMGELRSAEMLLRTALAERPADIDLLLGLGEALTGQERFQEAGPWLQRALALAPGNMRVRTMHAANLVNQCRYVEGLAACEQLQAEGVPVPALGVVLAYLGRFEEARVALDRSVADFPNDPNVRFFRASLRLLHLDFEGGWEDYAYRGFSTGKDFRVLPFPAWQGEPLAGKKIVVLAEQGLGDQVMFSSCLPDLLRCGASEVVVEVIRRIAPTLQRSFPQCRVLATSQSRRLEWVSDCPDMDYYVPLGDLPRHFRRSLEEFPSHRGFLVPAPERVSFWRDQLRTAGPGPYIGISWQGGTERTRTSLRSLTPAAFQPLTEARQATWVCLQYGKVDDDVEQAAREGMRMSYWPEAIADLDDFAALIAALDLVVSVCNTTVHYAGGLGKPVWVLAPSVPEWRYGASNRSLPWYPSSRVYRQQALSDWSPVFSDVRRDLSEWVPPGEAGTPIDRSN